MSCKLRTFVYIDGFNLYYRCLKGTKYKWLDLLGMAKNILPSDRHDILAIRYFTARINRLPENPDAPARQDVYLRALKAYIPCLDIVEGHFLTHRVCRPLAPPEKGFANVLHTEEKGTDVNLAVHLLNDAWLDRYDCAVLVSNDSDMAESVKLAKQRGKLVGWLMPGIDHISQTLAQCVDFKKAIRQGMLSRSQLPDSIPGTNLSRPANW